MTRQVGAVVQVVGRARAGDPVTATALALHAAIGSRGRLTAADPGSMGIERYDGSMDGRRIVHTVDGGEALGDLVSDLAERPLTLVHHGSAIASDRQVLRALRASTDRAVAADPAARVELRGLGFSEVHVLDGGAADDAFAGVVAHQATIDNLAQHPGRLLLCIGPIAPNRGVEVLLDAFADLLTHAQPSAVLSLCGPWSPWYRERVHRYLVRRGLLACEMVRPNDDGEVLARLDRADVVISLHPVGLDPYLRVAVGRGLPVVAPLGAATAWIDPATLVPVAHPATRRQLTAALAEALDRPPGAPGAVHVPGDSGVLAALGLA